MEAKLHCWEMQSFIAFEIRGKFVLAQYFVQYSLRTFVEDLYNISNY